MQKQCEKCQQWKDETAFRRGSGTSSNGTRKSYRYRNCRLCRARTRPLPNVTGHTTPNPSRVVDGTAYITLTDRQGATVAEALVDAADLPAVIAAGRWKAARRKHTLYVTTGRRTPQGMAQTYLHRFLMKPPSGLVVDHINGNGLDNRRENLRVVTRAENSRHRPNKIPPP